MEVAMSAKPIDKIPNRDMPATMLTKREFAAIMAMQGILANPTALDNYADNSEEHEGRSLPSILADNAVGFVDGLFDELEKKP
jgi:hypothetical protein